MLSGLLLVYAWACHCAFLISASIAEPRWTTLALTGSTAILVRDAMPIMQPSTTSFQGFSVLRKIPCHLEPTGLYRSDGKQPDGISIVQWSRGKALVWDATCPDTLAPSHTHLAVREAGAVAEEAERRKQDKYAHLEASHFFAPVAVESLGAFGPEARSFFKELGRRLTSSTMEPLSHQYLLQRVAVAVQQGNTAAILGTSAPPLV